MRGFRRFFPCFLALSGACTLAVSAADMEDHAEFRLARRALNDGLPAVAATKATRLLMQEGWSSTDRLTLAALAVESWVRARNGAKALELLAREQVPNKPFWEAQAKMLAGDVDGARQALETRLQEGEATSQERLLLAQAWLAAGLNAQARELLLSLRNTATPDIGRRARLMLDELDLNHGSYPPAVADLEELSATGDAAAGLLRARGLMEMGNLDGAEALLRQLLASTSGGERMHHAASVLLAEVMLREGRPMDSIETMVQFLDHTLESQIWTGAFDQLAKALESDPQQLRLPDACLRWISEGNVVQKQALLPPTSTVTFRGHALLLAARWLLHQKRSVEALGLLEALIQMHPNHPQQLEAMRLALETYGSQKADSRVTALADQWREAYNTGQSAMVDFVTGSTAFDRGEYTQSIRLFETAAEVAATLAERRAALYNAAVAALRAGELLLYQSLLGQLEVVSAGAQSTLQTGDTAADLELDQALDQAARGQDTAVQSLRAFMLKHTGHPRLAQAHLALAEVLLLQVPTDFAAIQSSLSAAAAAPGLTDKQKQQITLVRLWMLDKQGQLKALTEVGAEFLKTWPESSQAASVRMKVADAFYRMENFASARTEFELVAQEHASSPFADTALYFAGMAALSMMSDEGREAAINFWQEVAERGGPLSIPARQQQALAKRRAGQETEALKLLDSLLTEKNLPEDMRRSLTCERAEILMLLGKTDPSQLEKAVTSLRDLLREDDLTYLWSARAGYTLAAVLQASNRPTEALEACYDVVQASGFTGPSSPPEFRWYYRAGFFGIDLLEAQKEWEAAARLAEKLALSTGDRAAEAKEMATRIRLEHFLWDTKP